MKTRVEEDGRVLIPKEFWDAAGFAPGAEVDVHCRNGRLEMEPSVESSEPAEFENPGETSDSPGFHLERRGRFLVAVPNGPVPVLTRELVESVREAIWLEREAEILSPRDAD